MKSKKLLTLITFFAFVLSLEASTTKVFDKELEPESAADSAEKEKELPEYSYPTVSQWYFP